MSRICRIGTWAAISLARIWWRCASSGAPDMRQAMLRQSHAKGFAACIHKLDPAIPTPALGFPSIRKLAFVVWQALGRMLSEETGLVP